MERELQMGVGLLDALLEADPSVVQCAKHQGPKGGAVFTWLGQDNSRLGWGGDGVGDVLELTVGCRRVGHDSLAFRCNLALDSRRGHTLVLGGWCLGLGIANFTLGRWSLRLGLGSLGFGLDLAGRALTVCCAAAGHVLRHDGHRPDVQNFVIRVSLTLSIVSAVPGLSFACV